jgi:hypothetical protein
MLVRRIPANLISLLICRQSPCAGDMTLKVETVCTETVSEIEIYNISVRIVETKFARTDVPKGSSAGVLESLVAYESLTYQRPPKKGRDLKSAHRDEGEYAGFAGQRGRKLGVAWRSGSARRSHENAQKRPFAACSVTLCRTSPGKPKSGLENGGLP